MYLTKQLNLDSKQNIHYPYLSNELKKLGVEIEGFNVIFCSQFENCLPVLKEKDSACYDIGTPHDYSLFKNKSVMVETNLKVFMNNNLKINLYPRSSLFKKTGLILLNSVGIIDSSYRGEIKANCYNLTETKRLMDCLDYKEVSLFQIEIQQVLNHNTKKNIFKQNEFNILGLVSTEVYNNFDLYFPSDRGNGGFGSTDKI